MASTATTRVEVGFPSRARPRTTRSLSPSSSCSLRVETTVPITLPISTGCQLPHLRFARLGLGRLHAAQGEDEVDARVWARDDVDRDQLAHPFRSARACFGGGL